MVCRALAQRQIQEDALHILDAEMKHLRRVVLEPHSSQLRDGVCQDRSRQRVSRATELAGNAQLPQVSAELLAQSTLAPGTAHAPPPMWPWPTAAPALGDITRPWNYMACSALVLEPLTSDGNGFFVEREAQVGAVEHACRARFRGVRPRVEWMRHAYGNGAQLAATLRNVLFKFAARPEFLIMYRMHEYMFAWVSTCRPK